MSFRTLLDELEVSPATLKRDLAYLKDRLGAPIEYDRFANGYRFGEELRGHKHELPGLWFSERELYSLLLAYQLLSELDPDGVLKRHLNPLLGRIQEMLQAGEASMETMLQRIRIVSPAQRPVAGEVFDLVAEALTQRLRLQMRYLTRGRGEVTTRTVSPQRLVHYRGTWYLDAWCHSRNRLLRFAVDAIEEADLMQEPALDIAPQDVAALMDAGYGIYAGATPTWATLRFDGQAAQWVSKELWHPDQQGAWTDDGRYELKVPYTDVTELVMDLLRHAGHVEVLSPPELKEAVRRRLTEALEVG